MEKTFKEYLEIAKKNDIDIIKMEIAVGVEHNIITSRFETVCRYIHRCYIEDKSGEITIDALISCFEGLQRDEEMTEQEILDMREYKFIEKASYYL